MIGGVYFSWHRTAAFARTIAGEVVGTATTTTYGPELAWIGMVPLIRTSANWEWGQG